MYSGPMVTYTVYVYMYMYLCINMASPTCLHSPKGHQNGTQRTPKRCPKAPKWCNKCARRVPLGAQRKNSERFVAT